MRNSYHEIKFELFNFKTLLKKRKEQKHAVSIGNHEKTGTYSCILYWYNIQKSFKTHTESLRYS